MNFDIIRPSTLARFAEDTIINGFGHIARTAGTARRAVANEYRARSVVKLQSDIEETAAKIAAMSPEQRARFAEDQRIVSERIAALMDSQEQRARRKAARKALRAAKRKAKSAKP